MIVGAVLLVAVISPSALAWISFAGSADAAALTLAASASWRLTAETASFAESAPSVVEATCGGEEITLGPKEPVVIAICQTEGRLLAGGKMTFRGRTAVFELRSCDGPRPFSLFAEGELDERLGLTLRAGTMRGQKLGAVARRAPGSRAKPQ